VAICGLEGRITGDARRVPLNPDDIEDRLVLEQLVSTLDSVIDHHVFEECVIFPLISNDDDSELAILLAREHGAIEPMARRVRSVAEGMLQHGTSPFEWEEFCAAAGELIVEVLRHLQKEEQTVVQRLGVLLDSETDTRLALRMSELPAEARRALAENEAPTGSDAATARERNLDMVFNRRLPAVTVAARAAARRRSMLHHPAR
jgi:hemerythrin-like domain-containing protein